MNARDKCLKRVHEIDFQSSTKTLNIFNCFKVSNISYAANFLSDLKIRLCNATVMLCNFSIDVIASAFVTVDDTLNSVYNECFLTIFRL